VINIWEGFGLSFYFHLRKINLHEVETTELWEIKKTSKTLMVFRFDPLNQKK